MHEVSCLECGQIYAKPLSGGTIDRNPGCPTCGYVGWISVSISRELAQRRSGADRPQPPSA